MSPEALKQVAEALRFAREWTGRAVRDADDSKDAELAASMIDRALALLAAEQAKAPPDRERLAHKLEIAANILREHPSAVYQGEQLYREAAAALRLSPVTAGEWQPIETAPKGDGDEGPDILAFGNIRPHSGYKQPHYIENTRWYRTGWTITFMDGHEPPTYWMPLPPSPKEAGR